MKTLDLLSLSTRMFKTRPMRTFLTVLGVGVGIGTVLFLVGLGYGLQEVILQRIASADALLTLDVSPGPSESLRLTPESIQRLTGMPEVKEISRLKNYSAQISLNEITSNAQVSMVDQAFFRLQGVRLVAGKAYEQGETDSVIVSSATARLLNLTSDEMIGKSLLIDLILPVQDLLSKQRTHTVRLSSPMRVVGVLEDDVQGLIMMPFTAIPNEPVRTVDQLKVRVASESMLESVRNALITQGFVVSALSDVIEQANRIFHIIQTILALFGLVALFVSAIGMFNTMTIALLERTNEIGIMRSIGIRRSDVRKLFLVESMLMGFLGGLIGVAIGMLGGSIANAGINILARRFGGAELSLFLFPTWFIALIIVFSTAIGFFTGLYPSHRASRLNPLDALRYK